jgi:hypothetical protein
MQLRILTAALSEELTMLLVTIAVAVSCLTLAQGQDSGVNFGGEQGSNLAPDSPASDPIPAEPGSAAANGTVTEVMFNRFSHIKR